MSAVVRPYLTMRSSGFPDSPKVSLVPTLSRGTHAPSQRTSATAEPRPPMMLCSSAVTQQPVFATDCSMASLSMGLIVDMLMTSALTPSVRIR